MGCETRPGLTLCFLRGLGLSVFDGVGGVVGGAQLDRADVDGGVAGRARLDRAEAEGGVLAAESLTNGTSNLAEGVRAVAPVDARGRRAFLAADFRLR